MRREDIRKERARERERERRLEAKDAHGFKKSKLTRDRDRDVSEKMALGQVIPPSSPTPPSFPLAFLTLFTGQVRLAYTHKSLSLYYYTDRGSNLFRRSEGPFSPTFFLTKFSVG